jgi:hypothetical protein
MIYLRRGTVTALAERRPGLLDLTVDVDGDERTAVAFPVHTGPIRAGDRVVLNVGAVELRLGTGGVDFVVAVEGAEGVYVESGGAMKLRYTGLQSIVAAVEETHGATLETFSSLEGAPVILPGLHSALAPVCIAAKTIAEELRIAYVMTDAAALALPFSDTVAALRGAGLLDATVTTGQAFGGDFEAVNVYSGIAAARTVAKADLVVAGMGPGNLGTGTRLGFALIEQGALVNAVVSLGGTAIVVPRISFTDRRARHVGLSHHTVTALTLSALAPATVVLPNFEPALRSTIDRALSSSGIGERHAIETVVLSELIEEALRDSPVPLRSMGRTFADDPQPFRAAAAAGVLAARLATGAEPGFPAG